MLHKVMAHWPTCRYADYLNICCSLGEKASNFRSCPILGELLYPYAVEQVKEWGIQLTRWEFYLGVCGLGLQKKNWIKKLWLLQIKALLSAPKRDQPKLLYWSFATRHWPESEGKERGRRAWLLAPFPWLHFPCVYPWHWASSFLILKFVSLY